MFVDTSVIVAILSREDDHLVWTAKMKTAQRLVTSPLVILEAAMRLSSKLDLSPSIAKAAIARLMEEAQFSVVEINEMDGFEAIAAFEAFGKGRHPARLNLADCLSYACAKNRGLTLLYKGADFSKTDLA